MNNYKDLKLHQENIDLAIQLWCEENKLEIINVISLKLNNERYEISSDILFDVYFKDNTVTFTRTGSNTKKQTELADYIVANCLNNEKITDTYFKLKLLSEKQFQDLLHHLKKSHISKSIDFSIKGKPICFYNSKDVGRHNKRQEYIYLTHYNTGSFLLQGRRSSIFDEVIAFLSHEIDNKIIIKAQLETFENTKSITAAQSLQILENKIPNLYNHLPDELKTLIAPTITLKALNIDLTEYSCLAFPLLKGLEGILKLLFNKAGKTIGTEGFGKYIEDGKIKSSYISHFVSHKMKDDIEQIYGIYKQYRHPLFHVDGNITTMRLVEDREEIYEIIDDIFISIDSISYFTT